METKRIHSVDDIDRPWALQLQKVINENPDYYKSLDDKDMITLILARERAWEASLATELPVALRHFELGNYDKVPLDKLLYSYDPKDFVVFTQVDTDLVIKLRVSPQQLEHDNQKLHILPFPETEGEFGYIPWDKIHIYATSCLIAQLPEIQAEAAQSLLSEKEFRQYLSRSFGNVTERPPRPKEMSWMHGAEVMDHIVQYLRDTRGFKTACRLWAEGERAVDGVRCWPPTFALEKHPGGLDYLPDSDA